MSLKTPSTAINDHEPSLPIIPFGIVAYGFVGQALSKQLYTRATFPVHYTPLQSRKTQKCYATEAQLECDSKSVMLITNFKPRNLLHLMFVFVVGNRVDCNVCRVWRSMSAKIQLLNFACIFGIRCCSFTTCTYICN